MRQESSSELSETVKSPENTHAKKRKVDSKKIWFVWGFE